MGEYPELPPQYVEQLQAVMRAYQEAELRRLRYTSVLRLEDYTSQL